MFYSFGSLVERGLVGVLKGVLRFIKQHAIELKLFDQMAKVIPSITQGVGGGGGVGEEGGWGGVGLT